MGYVILGVGASGITAAKTIRKADKETEITMISTDEQVHSRCMLHKYLSHERTAEELNFVPEDFFEIYEIWKKKKISLREASRRLQVDHNTFKKWASQFTC